MAIITHTAPTYSLYDIVAESSVAAHLGWLARKGRPEAVPRPPTASRMFRGKVPAVSVRSIAHDTTPASFHRPMSSHEHPSSSRTSSVCAPASCAGRSTVGGAPANCTGFAQTRTSPDWSR